MLFPTPLRDPERLREVMAQITEGLHAVHSAGRLHRDLKPDNVLCTREGRAVLLDFGIVSDEPREVHRTLEPGVLGTPAYMSPEQAAGDPVDASSDFYALGSMMYEALTGAIPFDGNYTDVLLHKQERDPPPPSHLVSGVPADLESLCMSLLHRDPTQRPHADAVLRALRSRKIVSLPPAPTAAERDSGPLFVGRARELDALRSALSTTNSGKPVVTLLSGPSGIGKTTLVERFIHEIVSHDDGIVLKGRCYERESVPFKAIDSLVDSLSRYLRQLSPVHVAEVMPRDVLALAQLFPVLHRVEDVSQIKRRAPLPADPKELRRRAFAALSELFSRIADRSPLFLFIDDMQWGDVDSAKLLADLVSGSDAPAVLLLCAYRSGEIDSNPCLRTLLGQLRDAAHREVRELTLGALSPEESLTLAQLLLGPTAEAEAAAVGAEANGSPYLLTELVQHVRERGRGGGTQISLESALQERLAALSKDARTLLQLVCVAARPVPEETLALASAFDIDLQSAMVELRAAKLVRGVTLRSHRAVEAYHDRVRDAVISRMPPELLALWHRRLASTLEASGSLDLEALTDHLLGAGESARAGLYALRAAAQAERVLAFDKAARLYAIAVVHHGQTDADKRELLLRWGDALVNAGRSAEAANVYLEMSKLADGKHAEELRRKAGIQLVLGGQIEEGIETLRETLREMGAELPPNFPEALHEVKRLHDELGRRGLRFVTRTGAQQRVDVLARLDALWSLALGLLINELERPLPLVGRYLLDALDAGEPEHVLQGLCLYHAYIDGALRSGSEPARVGALPAAEELARQIDGPRARALLSLAYGADAHRAGAWQQALAQLVPAEDAFRKQGPSGVNEMRMARLIITSLHHTFGACDELQIAERWAREAEEREDSLMASRLRLATSQLLLAQDDPRGASERCDEAMRPWHGADAGLTSFAEWMARVQIELYTENTARCEARSFEQEDFLRSPLATIAVWRARALLSRARAALCASLGTSGTRNVLVERAAADIDRVLALQLPCFTDQLRLLSAAVAQQRGQRTRALELLDAVLISRDAEAQPLVLASALRRRGELSGPDAGELVARGDNLMRERGVVAPERMTRLYAPGFAQHPQ
jgi:tetratricopeptide (TPR) repeat protein